MDLNPTTHLASKNSGVHAQLYEGERLEAVAGYQTLFKFLPSDSSLSSLPSRPAAEAATSKPLVVFVPGSGHWARVAYGGHAGSRPEDFLAYWLNTAGFDVLAVSYPLESQLTLIDPLPTSLDFRIPTWGKQVAGTARWVLDENRNRRGTGNEVILVAWSMAGKILKPFMASARACGLEVKLFISLAATPGGMTGLQPSRSLPMDVSPAGYSSLAGALKGFLRQVHEQNDLQGSRVIIDDDAYLREYCGNVPVGLMGWSVAHDICSSNEDHSDHTAGESVSPEWEALQDAGPTYEDFRGYPFIGIIHPTLPSDLRHSLADSVTWGMVLTYKLVADIQTVPPKIYRDLPECWEQLTQLVQSAPEQMTFSVTGNHFFFLGEKGARETAQAVVDLLGRMEAIQSRMTDLLLGYG
jgi:hypothetical protein